MILTSNFFLLPVTKVTFSGNLLVLILRRNIRGPFNIYFLKGEKGEGKKSKKLDAINLYSTLPVTNLFNYFLLFFSKSSLPVKNVTFNFVSGSREYDGACRQEF